MNKSRVLAICVVWSVLLLCVFGTYRFFLKPKAKEQQQQAKEQEQEHRLKATSSNRKYTSEIHLGLDSFSGYCITRTQEFSNYLGSKSIKLVLEDDKADYIARIKGLQEGKLQAAVFTIDALIKASASINDMPGTIVCFVDKSQGADAIVGYKRKYPNIQSLNNPKTRFVLTPDSPSEMMARVLQAHFELPDLPGDCYIKADGVQDVYDRYRKAAPTDDQVYIVWEPYVQKMLENPNLHIIVDSSKFRDYIVDVLVVSRDFLIKDRQGAKSLVEAYFRANYDHQAKMVDTVLADGRLTGEVMSRLQSEKLVSGIRWENVLENYAQMGILTGDPSGLQNIENMIENINTVLVRSKAISGDPTKGHPNMLYYNQLLGEMQSSGWHPGSTEESNGSIRKDGKLDSLTDEQWGSLLPVGNLQVDQIIFARGTDRLTDEAKSVLDSLVKHLKTWPTYYVAVKGNASTEGDAEANKLLVVRRATAAAAYLADQGIDKNRIRAIAGEPTGVTSVTFMLGQRPY